MWERWRASCVGRPCVGTADAVGQSRAGSGWAQWPSERPPVPCACREKWCHMTQEERDDSLRFNENITFGQLG